MERELKDWEITQIKSFTKWAQTYLIKRAINITDITKDFANGINLWNLAELIVGEDIKGKMHKNPRVPIEKIDNCQLAISFLIEKRGVKFVGIGPENIVNQDMTLTLGFFWTLILNTRMHELAMSGIKIDGANPILRWSQKNTKGYDEVQIEDFSNSWKSGLGFCALLNRYHPELIDYDECKSKTPEERVNKAIEVCNETGITNYIDASDIMVEKPDDKSIMLQVSEYMLNLQNKYILAIDMSTRSMQVGYFQTENMKTKEYKNIFDYDQPKQKNEHDNKIETVTKNGNFDAPTKDDIYSIIQHKRPLLEIDPTHEKINIQERSSIVNLFNRSREVTLKQTGENITETIVAVPSEYTETGKQVIRECANEAGLKVIAIVTAPVANSKSLSIPDTVHPPYDHPILLIADTRGDVPKVSIREIKEGKVSEVKSVTANESEDIEIIQTEERNVELSQITRKLVKCTIKVKRETNISSQHINEIVLITDSAVDKKATDELTSQLMDLIPDVPLIEEDVMPPDLLTEEEQDEQDFPDGEVHLSISTDNAAGTSVFLIKRGLKLPQTGSITFSTLRDNQTRMDFPIFQGERLMAKDNIQIGSLSVRAIPKAKAGVSKIKIIVSIDENNQMTTKAEDLTSHRNCAIVMRDKKVLSKPELRQLIRDAKIYELTDLKNVELAKAKAPLNKMLIQATDKSEDQSVQEKLGGGEITKFKNAIKKYKDWLEQHPSEEPPVYKDMERKAIEELQQFQ